MRRRRAYVEWSLAYIDKTRGMRRTHLRDHTNILKRLLTHARSFNLGLVIRQPIGPGAPRALQGRLAAVLGTLWALVSAASRRLTTISLRRLIAATRGRLAGPTTLVNSSAPAIGTTAC